MQDAFLSHILVVLLIATVVQVVFAKARLPSVLGYLVVGIIVGPDMLGFLSSQKEMEFLSELGIILMMFMIGLDFSWPKLRRSLKMIAGVGTACMVSVTGVCMLALMKIWEMDVAAAFIIGGAIAMSSSVVINKQLMDQKEFYDSHGKIAFGITLFQDFAALLFLAALPALAQPGAGQVIAYNLAVSLGTAIAVLGALYIIGQKVERPLMRSVGALKSDEIFVLTTLVIIISAAWVSNYFHLPATIGAFLAGMIVGETEFRYKIEDDIRPFRDIMVGIFFIVMGLTVKLPLIVTHFGAVIGVMAAMMLVKLLLTSLCVYLYDRNFGNSLRVGLVLSSCDEFSLILVLLGMQQGIIAADVGNILLIAFVLSLVLSTILILHNRAITFALLSAFGYKPKIVSADEDVDDEVELSDHVIICGFGETGKNFNRMLRGTGLQVMAIDVDPQQVESAMRNGCTAMYGDSTSLKTLKSAGLAKARALILTFDDYAQSMKIVQKVRGELPELPIIVRVHHIHNVEDLMMMGATMVFADGLVGTNVTTRQDIMQAMKIPEGMQHAGERVSRRLFGNE